MERVAECPVAPPHSQPTQPYWNKPQWRLAYHRTTDIVPKESEFIVIGSGITGAVIAYNILSQRPGAKVIMFEAREACGGATGRNGGHTKAASYRTFVANAQRYGADEAARIAKLERANIVATHEFAKREQIACDSHPCNTVDVFYDQNQWENAISAIEYMGAILGRGRERGTDFYDVRSRQYAETVLLCSGALGALEYEAGSINGYKFATGVLQLAVEKGLNLQTLTPVTKLVWNSTSHNWTVATSRGEVRSVNVIVATNGYTANLLEQFHGIIVPLRGQVNAQRPGASLPNSGSLPVTYSFIYEDGYDYMITRPSRARFAGDMVIGGGLAKASTYNGLSEFGTTDDSKTNESISEYLKVAAASYFGSNWGTDHKSGRIRQEWTGIMGVSADGLPYVGRVPNTQGLWVCSGFNGHGMALCVKCADAVTSMILSEDDANGTNEWFPKSFRITPERLEEPFVNRLKALTAVAARSAA